MSKKYIKLVHADATNTEWFVVNWCLGNTCNYACSYCPKGLHDGSQGWPKLETIQNFILKVKERFSDKKLYFEFTGGEVTVYKHFLELAQFCKDQDVKIGLISNGSRTQRWWDENKLLFDHVCLSFHPEFADPEHFLKILGTIHNDTRTHVNVMMSPEKFDECYKLAERVVEYENISIALQPLIVDFGDTLYNYTEEQKKVFDTQHQVLTPRIKHTKEMRTYRGAMKMVNSAGQFKLAGAHQFIARNANDWSGWKCYAGLEQLIVDMDGTVHRGWCKVGGPIGRIDDPNLSFPDEPVICNKTMCHCNFDIMCTKEQ